MSDHRPRGSRSGQAGPALPAWPSAQVVVAHPGDESFGLGAVIDRDWAGRCPPPSPIGSQQTPGSISPASRRAASACVSASAGNGSGGPPCSTPAQVSPGAVLWRRLRRLGDNEYLRWLVRPAAAITSPPARRHGKSGE